MSLDVVPTLINAAGVFCGLWLLIAISGAVPVYALWKGSVEEVDADEARQHIQAALASGQVTGEWAI